MRVHGKFHQVGSALIFVLMIAVFLALVSVAVASLSDRTLRDVSDQNWTKQTRFAAYAGIQDGLTKLAAAPDRTAPLKDISLTEGQPYEYSVYFDNNVDGTEGRYAFDNTTWIPAGSAYLLSVGALPNRMESCASAFAALAGPQRMRFNHAIFGTQEVFIESSKVLEWDPDGVLGSEKNQAHVGTNSNTALPGSVVHPITQIGGSVVEGELRVGVGGHLGLINDAGSTNAGKKVADEVKLLTDIKPPSDPFVVTGEVRVPVATARPGYIGYLLHPGIYDHVIVPTGATLVLAPVGEQRPPGSGEWVALGTYSFERLTLEPGARIAVQGAPGPGLIPPNENFPIQVYIRDRADFQGGNIVNWNTDTDQPFASKHLQFYFCDSSANLQVGGSGSNKLSFIAAGKELVAEFVNASVYGSVVGKKVTLRNSEFHFDVRLRGIPLEGVGEFAIQSIVELPRHYATQVALAGGPVAAAPPPPAPPPPPIPPAWPGGEGTTTGTGGRDADPPTTTGGTTGTGTSGTTTGGTTGTGTSGTTTGGTTGTGTTGTTTGGTTGTGTTGTTTGGTTGTGTTGTTTGGTTGTGTTGTTTGGTTGTGTTGTTTGGTTGTGTTGTTTGGTTGTGTTGTTAGDMGGVAPHSGNCNDCH